MFSNDQPDAPVPFSRGRSTNKALTGPVEEFLAHMKARKLSAQSIKKRKDDLRKLLVYLDARGIKGFQEVELKTLEAYRFALVEHGYSDSIIESSLRAASQFFRFLEDRGHIFENPARRLKVPKAPLVLGTVLTDKEVQRILAMPKLTHRRGLRDRSILEVLYSTGMRRGEAAGLTLFDVQLDQATVKVTGKGRKQRVLPLGKHAVKYLRIYIKEARPKYLPKFTPATDALWLDRYRRAISPAAITELISRYAKACGMDKSIDAHTFRRTCATQMLRAGAHPVVVAQLLGHSGLRSLSHYLRTTIGDLMRSHARTNPGR